MFKDPGRREGCWISEALKCHGLSKEVKVWGTKDLAVLWHREISLFLLEGGTIKPFISSLGLEFHFLFHSLVISNSPLNYNWKILRKFRSICFPDGRTEMYRFQERHAADVLCTSQFDRLIPLLFFEVENIVVLQLAGLERRGDAEFDI